MAKVFFKGSAMLNPAPAVLITTKNSEGKVNVFTVAWIGTACSKPPMITIGVRPERLSYDYIKQSGEFVVNLPSAVITNKVDLCGVKSGRELDKIVSLGFKLEDCKNVSVPMLAQCPVSLECKVKSITPLGSHNLILAEIVGVNVDENIIDAKGKIHLESANLICYSHGEYYELPRKSLGTFGFSVKRKKASTNIKK
jgi:flavin reductase (DIM6/NTAB) family NADH-FMN oxidoreductase RutF